MIRVSGIIPGKQPDKGNFKESYVLTDMAGFNLKKLSYIENDKQFIHASSINFRINSYIGRPWVFFCPKFCLSSPCRFAYQIQYIGYYLPSFGRRT
jgi:hypothetical protein